MTTILGEKTSLITCFFLFFCFLVTCTVFIWTSHLFSSFGRAPIALVCDTLMDSTIRRRSFAGAEKLGRYIHMIFYLDATCLVH